MEQQCFKSLSCVFSCKQNIYNNEVFCFPVDPGISAPAALMILRPLFLMEEETALEILPKQVMCTKNLSVVIMWSITMKNVTVANHR